MIVIIIIIMIIEHVYHINSTIWGRGVRVPVRPLYLVQGGAVVVCGPAMIWCQFGGAYVYMEDLRKVRALRPPPTKCMGGGASKPS